MCGTARLRLGRRGRASYLWEGVSGRVVRSGLGLPPEQPRDDGAEELARRASLALLLLARGSQWRCRDRSGARRVQEVFGVTDGRRSAND